jgi:hypothetical protein
MYQWFFESVKVSNAVEFRLAVENLFEKCRSLDLRFFGVAEQLGHGNMLARKPWRIGCMLHQ